MNEPDRYLLNLTDSETEKIVRSIEPQLWRYATKYDERKYPPAELARLRTVFATPGSISENDIVAALVWKYGHTSKPNFPTRHRKLADRIALLWPENGMRRTREPRDDFRRWSDLVGRTGFITVCFLLHLVHPDIPILDTHNYRSVNEHVAVLRPAHRWKRKPSRFDDLLLVREFSIAVMRGWERYGSSEKPTADLLDRYLMMYGKWKSCREASTQL